MNGCGIDLHSLADTGANGFLFINRPLARRLSQSLNTPLHRLPYAVPVGGFDGKTKVSVNQFIRLHLTIDGRRIRNCPFLILDLGNQDVIIGIKWMRRFRVHLDPERNKLIWPSDAPPNPHLAKEIKLPYFSPKLQAKSLNHQADANRRDQALEDQMRRHERSRLGNILILVLRL
jgi:predicted aspartyl protease